MNFEHRFRREHELMHFHRSKMRQSRTMNFQYCHWVNRVIDLFATSIVIDRNTLSIAILKKLHKELTISVILKQRAKIYAAQ